MQDVTVGISFRNRAPVVNSLIRSIAASRFDHSRYRISLVLVIDAADHSELLGAVSAARAELTPTMDVEIVVNESGLGIIHGSNAIINNVLSAKSYLVLIDPAMLLFNTALAEMIEVAASDPMIAFVGPRANDAFSLPATEYNGPVDYYTLFQSVASRLPKASYVPVLDARCILCKSKVLQDFGPLDTIFDQLGDAATDLIFRANRYGYRAAVANWAFAYLQQTPQPVSPNDARSTNVPASSPRGETILTGRYPHYSVTLKAYYASPDYRATALSLQLHPIPRRSVAFDFSSFGSSKNGTTEYGTNLLRGFARLFAHKYALHVICDPEMWRYHQLHLIEGLSWSPIDSDTKFAAVFRPSQPFDVQSLSIAASRGGVAIFTMLDTIAYDCLHLREPHLSYLWSFVMEHSDAVIYISRFSQEQYMRRFATNSRVIHATCMPSTESNEYAGGTIADPASLQKVAPATRGVAAGEYLLVVGNQLAHKAVRETVELVRGSFPDAQLRVLGIELLDCPEVQSLASGMLHATTVNNLFQNAKIVIYPSHYEGFGFPIMHALGHGKQILVREQPVYHEIKGRVAAPENIRMFRTNAELIVLLAEACFDWRTSPFRIDDVGWARSAGEHEAVLVEALEGATAHKIATRLAQLDLLSQALNVDHKARQQDIIKLEQQAREFQHLQIGYLQQAERDQQQIGQLQQNIADAHQRLGQVQLDRQQLEEHLDAIRSSTSWRITAPVRKLKWYLTKR